MKKMSLLVKLKILSLEKNSEFEARKIKFFLLFSDLHKH